MSFAADYKLSSYLFAASGFLAIATTGAVSPAALALFFCVVVSSWFIDTAKLRRALPAWLWKVGAHVCLPAAYLESRLLAHSFLLGALHLMFFVAAAKFLTREAGRDDVYLYLLSFGALLLAAELTTSFIFLVCLLVFLVSGMSALILFEMKQSSARARSGGMIQPVVVPRSLRGTVFELFAGFPSRRMAALTLMLAAAIVALAVPLFFLLPRATMGVHRRAAGRLAIISGFSETVELGDIGRIQESDELVMKVKVDVPRAQQPPDLKWRGLALDHFDGRSWSRSRPDRIRIPTQAGYFKMQQTTQGTNVLVQTFLLEPIATDIVFGTHQVLAVSADLGWLERDAADNVYSLAPRTSAIRYSVVSDVTRPDPRLIKPHAGPPPREIEACCLQVPQEDPRVAELARSVTAAAATPYDQALALESHLRTAYGYSLELTGSPDSTDPLARFLFDIRRGHCEYFATAMAVMLRQVGIPSRLVNGFRAGFYNSLSDHWTVRQYNAHSWVEAWLPPYGWVEFDPTPAGPEPVTPAFLQIVRRLVDAIDLWWSDGVVNYDLRKQSSLIQLGIASFQNFRLSARSLAREAAWAFSARLDGLRTFRPAFSVLGILVLLLALLLTAVWLRQPRRLLRGVGRVLARAGLGRDQRAAIVGFYAEALDILQSRGITRDRNQTPLEFARDLSHQPFGDALAALTAIYYRVRFGPAAPQTDITRVRGLLRQLRAVPKK